MADIEEFKTLFEADREHSAEWRSQAYDDFEFVAGRQWDAEEIAYLKEQKRPVIVFNRVNPVIQAVAGSEIKNREEVRFFPVEEGDIKAADILSQVAEWFRQKADADSVESDAFFDALVCGMGWTYTRVNYDDDPDGVPSMEHIDPLEMVWDRNARKKCLSDATRFWHVRTMTLAEAKRLFPDADPRQLDASWADLSFGKGGDREDKYGEDAYRDTESLESDDAIDPLRTVTIVHLEIKEYRNEWRVFLPGSNEPIWLDDEKFEKLKERFPEIQGVKQRRAIWKKYFLGNDILEEMELVTSGPGFQCITGYRDHNNGTWFGLLHFMRDPQKWANKWLSQILHILNTMAKGGVIVEKGAIDDTRKFLYSWAKSDEVTFVDDIQGIQPKPMQSVPSQLFSLMQYAVNSISEVSGVNPEALGMRAAIQPIGLEQERKETALTILSNLFDSLRQYRRRQGAVMFDLIRNFLADGRLIRIVGEGGAQYMPLVIDANRKYDIYVDEAPQSPYIKEKVWSFIAPMITQIPPQITAQLMEYAPIPASVAEKIKAALMQISQPDPMQQQAQTLELQKKAADTQMTQSAAMSKQAEAAERMAKAQQAKAKVNLDAAKIAADFMKE